MKVVVLSSYAPSLINFRGQLIEDIVQAGHSVVACAPGSHPETAAALAQRGAGYLSAPIRRTGLNPILDAWSIARLTGILRRLRPELVFSYTPKPVIYGSIAARMAKVPRVFAMITGLGYAFTEGRQVGRCVLRQITTRLYRASLSSAAGIFFQNPDDMAEFQRLAIVSERHNLIRVNGSGVDVSHFSFSPPRIEQPSFLLIARLLRDKGIVEYVEAARLLRARYPAARFRLVGATDSNPAAIALSELERWRAEGVVEYLGEAADVRGHLADSMVYVLPSYREGTPRTVLEAMASGRAIVTTDAPGCRETVAPGENGFLVPVGDAAALADAMERFILRPELALAMGARSRELAEQKYDVRRVNAVMLAAMGLA
jgi:glycosyltransferase involved in cell wall biosynthesis